MAYRAWKLCKNRFSYLIFNINIDFISIDIERNSKRGVEQTPLIKEVLELIHNHDISANSLLELVGREKTRNNDENANDEIAPRATEFDTEGMNKCPLNFDTNVISQLSRKINNLHPFTFCI